MKTRITTFLIIGALIILLSACSQRVETIVTEVPALRVSNIFNSDSVYLYMERYKGEHKEIGDFYLNGSKELLKTDPVKALHNAKRAITLNPTKEAYKQLIACLSNNEKPNWGEIENAYILLILPFTDLDHSSKSKFTRDYLFEEPDETLLQDFLVFNINTSGLVWGINSPYGPYVIGFALPDNMKSMAHDLKAKVLSDKRLKIDTTSEDYKNVLIQFLSPQELKDYLAKESTFKYFLSTIKDTTSIFEMDKNYVPQFDYDNFNGRGNWDYYDVLGYTPISYLYKTYIPEAIKDSNWNGAYNFEHTLKINDSINALIYSIDTSTIACPVAMRHIYHRLVIYGRNHRIISTDIVANQSGDELATVKFNHNKYTITHYKRYWEKPYIKGDFDNYLVKTEQLSTSEYEIKADGAIARVFDSTKQESAL